MNFEDIILDEFKTEEEDLILEFGAIPFTPFIAYTAFKKKIFNKLKNKFTDFTGLNSKKEKAKRKISGITRRAKMGADTGKKDKDATVNKLTKKQQDLMADIYNKYGKEIIEKIIKFRTNVLAPYQEIKRLVKSSGRVSSKDITGMNKEQFLSALESGRKKIEARGEVYTGKSKGARDKITDLNNVIKDLERIRDDFKNGKGTDPKILNRVYKKYDVGEKGLSPYSISSLRNTYDNIIQSNKEMRRVMKKGISTDKGLERSIVARKKSKDLWAGKEIDLTKTEKEQFEKRGPSGKVALQKYFLRRDIVKKLKPGTYNVYTKTYLSIIDDLLKRAKERKANEMDKLIVNRKSAEFTPLEKKIWEKRPSVKHFSGNIEDYYQKIKEEDFLNKPIQIKRSPKLIAAEQKIKNEIKKFERELARIVSAEDLKKLKRFRLINNLITFKELSAPEKLFKSSSEMRDVYADEVKSGKDIESKEYISPEDFIRKIREYATIEYDTMTELNNMKKEAKKLVKQMIDQGNKDIVDKNRSVIKQIETRRTPSAKKLSGQRFKRAILIDIDDIEELAAKILAKNYDDFDEAKQDNQRLQKMIGDYKESDVENAERNIKEIQPLLNRVDRKLSVGRR